MIINRFNSPKWSDLKDKISKLGWSINAPNSGAGPSSAKYPGNLVAAVINLSDFGIDPDNGVYSTVNAAHPLSLSTIFDGGGAVHLVNDRDLLVPGSFRPAKSGDCVDAGTQSLPVSGYGDRILKCVFNGDDGPKTNDLTLKDVRVVEGFHVNIISEFKLRKAGVWYMGYDSTLRFGSAENSIILAQLIVRHNLSFIEYKQTARYVPPSLIVNALGSSYRPKPRSDHEYLWHKRSGHLGQRALRALVHAAQNVNIVGTQQINCTNCATAHASQVISRRRRERSPRPFYRVSWDLFDMKVGRLHEKWALIMKEEFSGKIDNFNLHDKSLALIMLVMQKYERVVSQKYGLTIVELVQDNDQATLPWRGTSQFEIWCDEMGIRNITPPADTHEPSGSQERAGKEIITKSIKMRTGANFPEYLWPECMDASAFLHARCPSALHGFRSPNEVLDQWFRQYFRWYEPAQIRHRTADLRPDWSGIYAYGCRAYPLIQDKVAGRRRRDFKVQSRAHIGYLVGYIGTNIYRIWVPSLDQVIVTRNVKFDESTFYEGDPEEEMPVEQATQIADALHDGELINAAEELDIPLPG